MAHTPIAAAICSLACTKPANLAVSEITKNSVKLSWTEKGEATAWVVAYKAVGDADFTEVNATENPFTLTGLTPETEYTVKVRQAGETNKWKPTSRGLYIHNGKKVVIR